MNAVDELDEFISLLEGIEEELHHPQAFFDHHHARYLQAAQMVAHQTLLALRPPEIEPDEWREKSSDFVELIFARSITSGVGMEIKQSGRTGFDREEAIKRGVKRENFTPVNYADVLEWVKAGAENGGKDITVLESARDRSPEQIAYDVHTAIRQHHLGLERRDYSRIAQRLEEWIDSRGLSNADIDPILDAVLAAWTNVIAPMIERDFDDYLTADVLGN